MRESIGSVALYNIIIVFIVVTFAILAGTMSYSKAFKVNNRIINAIEKYEGYNDLAAADIDTQLMSIGYQMQNRNYNCPSTRKGVQLYNNDEYNLNPNYEFCIYKNEVETREWNGRYVEYGAVSYIYIDIPIIGEFLRIPVYGKTRKIFQFNIDNVPNFNNDVNYAIVAYWSNLLNFIQEYPYFEISPDDTTIKQNLEVYKKNVDSGSLELISDYNMTVSEVVTGDTIKKCKIVINSYDTSDSAELFYLIKKSGTC